MGTRYGHETRESLNLDFWLTITRGANGGAPGVKVTAGYPALSRNERAMNLKLMLPLTLFKAPALSATIKVDSPQQAITIDATAVAEAVRQSIGMDIDVRIVQPQEPT